ncbi:MAG TPA: hypothetical protein VF077_09380 [Nitrospiraceae bacterium]
MDTRPNLQGVLHPNAENHIREMSIEISRLHAMLTEVSGRVDSTQDAIDDAISRIPGAVATPPEISGPPDTGDGGGEPPVEEGLPDAIVIIKARYEYLEDDTLAVYIDFTIPDNAVGAHIFEEREDQSSNPDATMDGSIKLDGSANLGGRFSPIDDGKFAESPASIISEKPQKKVTRRYYLCAYNEDAERKLIRATEPHPTPSIKVVIDVPKYQSGEEYCRLVTDAHVAVEYDDTQVSGPKYRLNFKWQPPTDPPAIWQKPFGGCQIVYEYEDGSQANGPSMALNETDVNSDWYDLYEGVNIVKCWFVSYDGSEEPHLNSIVDGVTPMDIATIKWPLDYRPPEAPYADNVTNFDVRNMRYDISSSGQKILKMDAVWTPPPDGPARMRWGGVVIWLHVGTERFQVTGRTPTTGLTMEFPNLPKDHQTWVFYAVSEDNNGHANTDGRNPRAGTPTDTQDVDPPFGGLGTEYTGLVTGQVFTSVVVPSSDGTTTQRLTATFTPPANDITWGGVEMRVYDDTGKVLGKTSGNKSPLVVDLTNPAALTTATIKLVSYDVNNKTNTEQSNTPQGTVIIGAPTGTFDIRKYLPSSTDLFKLDTSGKIIVNVGQIYEDALMNDAISAGKIKDGAISGPKIAIGAVDAGNIVAGAIINEKLGINAVQAGNILAGAVVAGKIADNAVVAANIAAGAVIAGKIDANAVTAVTIAANAVEAGKIAANAVTALTIAANAIEAGKIAANAVTATEIAANAILAAHIKAGEVAAGKLAANSVVSANITAGEIKSVNIGADQVIAGKIATNAVAANQIAAGAVTSDKLYSVEIQVGGGGSKPGKFNVFNSGGASIGWIGTDSGNSGAWFQTISIGSTSYANGPLKADISGQVSLLFPAGNNSSNTIWISQTSYDSIYTTAGIRVANGASPSNGSDTAWLISRGLVVYGNSFNGSPGGGYYVVTCNRKPDPDGGCGEIVVYGASAANQVFIDGKTGTVRANVFQVGGSPGVDGTFTSQTGKTITVTKGIITNIPAGA